ncbi:MAG: radical SAM protein [Elusimicrobia bacterium]|nr:MAG: radical SAM protein [Elusimicrobiota bacterium]KAF0151953.1 MAG: radical SAM protein [Elusimicrobiota bacterium]
MPTRYRRAFIEITNRCNLTCSFCARSERPPRDMSPEEFRLVAAQVKPLAAGVFLHVLGEPMLHPEFPAILSASSELGLKVTLVTNGTLIDRFSPGIFSEPCLAQVSPSLQALSALPPERREEALEKLIAFARARPPGLIVVFRLRGADDPFSLAARSALLASFPGYAPDPGKRRLKLAENTFFAGGGLFGWPGSGPGSGKKSCLGLRHHFAVLSDLRVAPCCIDCDGAMALGDLREKTLAEALSSPAAAALRASIAGRGTMPAHCAGCGFNAMSDE